MNALRRTPAKAPLASRLAWNRKLKIGDTMPLRLNIKQETDSAQSTVRETCQALWKESEKNMKVWVVKRPVRPA